MALHDAHVQDFDFDILRGNLECAGDILSEYRSEVALYGDAWPGACEQVAWANKVFADYEAARKGATS